MYKIHYINLIKKMSQQLKKRVTRDSLGQLYGFLHEVLKFVSIYDALQLRRVSKPFHYLTKKQIWDDNTFSVFFDEYDSVLFRQSFPFVTRISSVQFSEDCTDIDFLALRGIINIKEIVLSDCNLITSGALSNIFSNIHNISELYLDSCEVTNDVLKHLQGKRLSFLNLQSCKKITDIGVQYLIGIDKLYMDGCTNLGFTGATLHYLHGICELYLSGCMQLVFTPEIVEMLSSVKKLEHPIDGYRELL